MRTTTFLGPLLGFGCLLPAMAVAAGCSGSATTEDAGGPDGGTHRDGGQDADGGAGACPAGQAGCPGSIIEAGGDGCTGASCGGCRTSADCPPTTAACVSATCTQGVCGTTNVPVGTACSDNGGIVCDGKGTCTASHCSDGVQDGDETAKDCGGASCPACEVGSTCKAPADCMTGDCRSGVCETCGTAFSTETCCPNGTGFTVVSTGTTCAPEGTQWISCDGRFLFIMQTDGNLVLYGGCKAGANCAGPLWASNTVGSGGCVSMQGDGNLVIYDSGGQLPGHAVWASGTNGHTPASLQLQNDGDLVLYSGAQTDGGPMAIWSTNTGGH